MHRFPGPNMLTEGHLLAPFPMLCYPKAYLAMWAHFGPTLAPIKGRFLASDFGVEPRIHGRADGVRGSNEQRRMALRNWLSLAEGNEVMRRSREPYQPKKSALELVENVAKGKTRDSTSCE